MRFGGTIESRHGVDDPDYQPPDESAEVVAPEDEWGHTLSLPEALIAALIPLAGFGLAIWRFGRGDIGPAIADLLLPIATVLVIALIFAAS